jgi:L-threonylcarbamoyladenylate synthase
MNDGSDLNTICLRVDPRQPEPEKIRRAAAVIRAGRLVAFPTETVYGLGANALDARAVARIFRAKERPSSDPLIVHLSAAEDLERVVSEVPEIVERLARAFWPGPLTLVLPKHPRVPDLVTAGKPTVAVRIPSHPVAHALIAESGVPIAAPSANRFGQISPTRPSHVLADLEGRIAMILDGGATFVGVESTVLSLAGPVPTILRPGGVSRESLTEVLGTVALSSTVVREDEAATSPGTHLKHYAPDAEVTVYRGGSFEVRQVMRAASRRLMQQGARVGVLVADEDLEAFQSLPVAVQSVGPADDLETVAQRLYVSLRALDRAGVSHILAREFGSRGLGLAVRDRLMHAASGRVIDVSPTLDSNVRS